MQKKFIVSKSGQEIGPLSEEELLSMLLAKQILPVDYFFDEAKNDWVLIHERFDHRSTASDVPPPVTVRIPIHSQPTQTFSTMLNPTSTASEQSSPSPTISGLTAISTPTSTKAPAPASAQKSVPTIALVGAPTSAAAKNLNPTGAPIQTPGLIADGTSTAPESSARTRAMTPVVLPGEKSPLKDDRATLAPPLPPVQSQNSATGPSTQVEAPTQEHRLTPETTERIHFVGGVGSISLKQLKAGQVAVKLQDCTMPSVKLPETATFQIAAGPAVSVRISAPDQIRAGEEFTISIYAQDKFGNATEQFEDSVDLEIVGEKPQTFKATFSKGYSEVTVQWTKAETLTLKVTSSVLTSCDPQQLLVLPGPPVQLLVESPKLAVAGEAIPVVVKAVDQFGNLATDFKGEISLGLTVRAS